MTLYIFRNFEKEPSMKDNHISKVWVNPDNELWVNYEGYECNYKICDLDENTQFLIEQE